MCVCGRCSASHFCAAGARGLGIHPAGGLQLGKAHRAPATTQENLLECLCTVAMSLCRPTSAITTLYCLSGV